MLVKVRRITLTGFRLVNVREDKNIHSDNQAIEKNGKPCVPEEQTLPKTASQHPIQVPLFFRLQQGYHPPRPHAMQQNVRKVQDPARNDGGVHVASNQESQEEQNRNGLGAKKIVQWAVEPTVQNALFREKPSQPISSA
jgi:hypothetical protein